LSVVPKWSKHLFEKLLRSVNLCCNSCKIKVFYHSRYGVICSSGLRTPHDNRLFVFPSPPMTPSPRIQRTSKRKGITQRPPGSKRKGIPQITGPSKRARGRMHASSVSIRGNQLCTSLVWHTSQHKYLHSLQYVSVAGGDIKINGAIYMMMDCLGSL
jgi:hypothetical protein